MTTVTATRRETTFGIDVGDREIGGRFWDGVGRPIVLLHGAPASSATWRPTVAHLDRPCLAIDLPGFGRTSLAVTPQVEHYVSDVRRVLVDWGITTFDVVAHSFGCVVAVALCGVRPVNDLVLLAPAQLAQPALRAVARRRSARTVASLAMPIVAARQGPGASRQPAANSRRVVGAAVDAARGTMTASAAAAQAQSNYTHGPFGDMPRVTHIVLGGRDRIVRPSRAGELRQQLPDARLTVLKNVGHSVHREVPGAVAALLTDGRDA